jgi:hypothetical protein
MTRSVTGAALLLLLTATAAAAQSQSTNATLRTLMPSGRVAVEVMEQYAPPRLAELTEKVKRAVAADPAWWQQHVAKAPAGKPIRYDPRIGLTEAEFQEFLALPESIELRPARVDTVVIVQTRTGWRFDEASRQAGVRGIEIDTVRNVIVTPQFGELPASNPIVASAGQKVTGAWGGPRWKREDGNETTLSGTIAHFSIAQHESGHTIIYLDARRVLLGRLEAQEYFFLRVVR